MLQKKICMVGAFATGKTSLVSRFVQGFYSAKYQTTVGVTISKKIVYVEDQAVNLILWDIYGEDEFQKIHMSYLRGSSGYILVVDGTRRETLSKAIYLHQRVEEAVGSIPFIVVLNKFDLINEWELIDEDIEELLQRQWIVIKGSAKTDLGVDDCFIKLAEQILEA